MTPMSHNNYISYNKKNLKDVGNSSTSSNTSLSRGYIFRKNNYSHYTFNKNNEKKGRENICNSTKNRNKYSIKYNTM